MSLLACSITLCSAGSLGRFCLPCCLAAFLPPSFCLRFCALVSPSGVTRGSLCHMPFPGRRWSQKENKKKRDERREQEREEYALTNIHQTRRRTGRSPPDRLRPFPRVRRAARHVTAADARVCVPTKRHAIALGSVENTLKKNNQAVFGVGPRVQHARAHAREPPARPPTHRGPSVDLQTIHRCLQTATDIPAGEWRRLQRVSCAVGGRRGGEGGGLADARISAGSLAKQAALSLSLA